MSTITHRDLVSATSESNHVTQVNILPEQTVSWVRHRWQVEVHHKLMITSTASGPPSPSSPDILSINQVWQLHLWLYGKSHAIRDHSVTCHPTAVTFPPLPQSKLVLDLTTPEGYKAELNWVLMLQSSSRSLMIKFYNINNQKSIKRNYLSFEVKRSTTCFKIFKIFCSRG